MKYNILCFILGSLVGYFVSRKPETNWDLKEKELTLQVDSLRKANTVLKQRISQRDSTLDTINVNYEKERINFANQSVLQQYEFFTNYINK